MTGITLYNKELFHRKMPSPRMRTAADFSTSICAKALNDQAEPEVTILTIVDAATLDGKQLYLD